ncbi:hypothetical protein HNP73_000404 [Amaricoccus macauensis]|uniref:Uncharacterized protein n=1 Tax=Amaricoccus macauensis TaxID=57001 RepID=A0A840SM01_9RHOB|nr:hypothetical protein [Amaricoccus macauensis]MBB5220483.1 hypothetical protein [Amaricoccus macauensis]
MTRLALAIYVLAGLVFNTALLALLWSLVGWISLAVVAGAAALCLVSLLFLTRATASPAASSTDAVHPPAAASSQAGQEPADRPPRRAPGIEPPGRSTVLVCRSREAEVSAAKRPSPPQG